MTRLTITDGAAALALLALSCDAASSPPPQAPPAAATGAPSRPAPDFTLKDAGGNPVTLSSFRGKGVVLSFWFLR